MKAVSIKIPECVTGEEANVKLAKFFQSTGYLAMLMDGVSNVCVRRTLRYFGMDDKYYRYLTDGKRKRWVLSAQERYRVLDEINHHVYCLFRDIQETQETLNRIKELPIQEVETV